MKSPIHIIGASIYYKKFPTILKGNSPRSTEASPALGNIKCSGAKAPKLPALDNAGGFGFYCTLKYYIKIPYILIYQININTSLTIFKNRFHKNKTRILIK